MTAPDDSGEDVQRPCEFDGDGEFVHRAVVPAQNDAACTLLWAKYDTDMRAYLRFWLDAIEYTEAVDIGRTADE